MPNRAKSTRQQTYLGEQGMTEDVTACTTGSGDRNRCVRVCVCV